MSRASKQAQSDAQHFQTSCIHRPYDRMSPLPWLVTRCGHDFVDSLLRLPQGLAEGQSGARRKRSTLRLLRPSLSLTRQSLIQACLPYKGACRATVAA